jgi:hypothetical protein
MVAAVDLDREVGLGPDDVAAGRGPADRRSLVEVRVGEQLRPALDALVQTTVGGRRSVSATGAAAAVWCARAALDVLAVMSAREVGRVNAKPEIRPVVVSR